MSGSMGAMVCPAMWILPVKTARPIVADSPQKNVAAAMKM
jgi:hypothetical protein